jgi:hypothetical protein
MIQPGLYEAIANVFIRREPRIVEGTTNNRVGKLTVGTQRQVHSVVTNPDNTTWGRISEADSAGIAEWVCIQGLNRSYMKVVEGSEPSLSDRLTRLEAWARTQGYK